MSRAWNPHLVTALAFLQRALGLHPRSHPFDGLSGRSLRALDRLSSPAEGLRFQVALRQLDHDWDLLSEEATENADALRLQLRVLELARDHPEADRLIRSNLQEAPIARLFHAIVAQARKDAASEIKIGFTPESIRVTHGEHEAMTIPANLEKPLRGILRFVEAAGYVRLRAFLGSGGNVPCDLDFVWVGPDRLTLTLI